MKKWKELLLVIFMVPVTAICGGYAAIGALWGAGTILLVLTGTHSWQSDISMFEVWVFITGLGGLAGLIGLWVFILSRERLTYRKSALTWMVVITLFAGIASALLVVYTVGFRGLDVFMYAFNAVLLILSAIGAYALLVLLKPNNRLQFDAAPPRD